MKLVPTRGLPRAPFALLGLRAAGLSVSSALLFTLALWGCGSGAVSATPDVSAGSPNASVPSQVSPATTTSGGVAGVVMAGPAAGAAEAGAIGSGGSAPVQADAVPAVLAKYTLVVDAPLNQSSVQGRVSVRGRAPGFLNVEVWDERGAKLLAVAPTDDGAFSGEIDVASLAAGPVDWTVHAWDSAPGQSFQHWVHVPLLLTISASASCAASACSGHGTCQLRAGEPVCNCESGYFASSSSCVLGAADPGTTYVPAGYQLAFSDEFSSALLDTSKWNTLAPWGVKFYADSHQQQAFVPEALQLKDGVLSFVAQRAQGNSAGQPYVSGSITSLRTFTRGYFEARVKVPAGKGLWPAYWLTSSVRWPPEWDIFEIVDGVDYGYTHPVKGGVFSFIEGAAGSKSAYRPANPYGVYHVYGFRWTETELYRFVDGVLTEHDAIDAAAGSGDPFWLNLSLQVGGDWPGNPDATTQFPARMDIDYVRVYQKP